VAHGREIFQELFSALLARESQILRQGNRGKQNKTKPNQTKPLYYRLPLLLLFLLAGWLAGLAGSSCSSSC
jgi:hypothetical protein